jgi:hypothetical protein
VGLFENRPHFSRALDPDLAAVAENEFRVAGARSGHDPHFSVDVAGTPWLGDLGLDGEAFDPKELRLALMSFFMSFSHRANPRAHGRTHFSDEERAGASSFRERCDRCHEARTATADTSGT